ncbi:MAG: methylated-DNA--[protein]-cysteine S-methyltransferase [Endomicrobiaceae bacterium]
MKNIYNYKTPVGEIFIAEEDNQITNFYFFKPKNLNDFIIKETPVLKNAKVQLMKYFNGDLKNFNLPLNPQASQISKIVLRQLQKIPYGKTLSYYETAKAINKPTYSRAVGMICGKNPIPVFIPCHRVIRSDGNLGGFSAGLTIKRFLLNMESKNNE